jgi:hypothetical protein
MALGWVLYRPDENHNGTVDLSLLLARRQRFAKAGLCPYDKA